MDKYSRRRSRLRKEGRCAHCGKPCAPYYECEERRRYKNAKTVAWYRRNNCATENYRPYGPGKPRVKMNHHGFSYWENKLFEAAINVRNLEERLKAERASFQSILGRMIHDKAMDLLPKKVAQ